MTSSRPGLDRRATLVGVAACLTGAALAQPVPTPETAVRNLIAAMTAGDAAAIRAAFAPDAGQAYGPGRLSAPDAFRRWLESDIITRQGRVDEPHFEARGNDVVVTGTYRSLGYESAANFLFEVRDGRIRSWRMRY
jgi:ketosteroid isomerase-like protein